MTLEELRKNPHLSVSAINDYCDCSLSYMFNRVEHREPEFVSDALVFGITMHRVLERLYQAKKRRDIPPLAYVLEWFENFWIRAVEETPNIQFKEGENVQSLLKKGKDLLATYWKDHPQDGYRVLATEYEFSFEIEGLDVPIIGVIDLIEADTENFIISDFKTSSRAYASAEIDKSLQLTLYYMAAKRNGFGDREILLRFDCLIKTKTPKFEQYYTVRTEEDEHRAIKKIRQVWSGIQKGVFIPNDTGWKCGYCSYKETCNHWFLQEEEVA